MAKTPIRPGGPDRRDGTVNLDAHLAGSGPASSATTSPLTPAAAQLLRALVAAAPHLRAPSAGAQRLRAPAAGAQRLQTPAAGAQGLQTPAAGAQGLQTPGGRSSGAPDSSGRGSGAPAQGPELRGSRLQLSGSSSGAGAQGLQTPEAGLQKPKERDRWPRVSGEGSSTAPGLDGQFIVQSPHKASCCRAAATV